MAVKSSKKGGKHDGINQKVADMAGCKPDYVAKVRAGLRGKRKTPLYEKVLTLVMEFAEADNKLRQNVSKIVDLEAPKKQRRILKYGDLIK